METIKQMYLNEIKKAWGNDNRMMLYFDKNLSDAYLLPSGAILFFEKMKIEKDFCFGYSDSAYNDDEYREANERVSNARTEDYLYNQNMRNFDEKYTPERKKIVLLFSQYYGAPRLNICEVTGVYSTLKQAWGENYEEISEQDIPMVKAAIESERGKFERKLNAYIKRYGATKVRAWSYWRDE